jgi:hypothetical protein
MGNLNQLFVVFTMIPMCLGQVNLNIGENPKVFAGSFKTLQIHAL